MKNIQLPGHEGAHGRFPKKVYFAFVIALVVFLVPIEAGAIGLSDIVSLIETITSTLHDEIGGVLSDIESVETKLNHYRQEVVWPLEELNQMRAFVGATRARYGGIMSQIHSMKNNSAGLTNPRQLESALRGGSSIGLNQFQPFYRQVYASVPSTNAASAAQRDMMDIDDALAMDALKTTVVSDQTTAQFLNLADSIEEQAATAAPGSAPILTAQARLTDLVAQAHMKKMIAAELRQEAASLAHQNALLKRSAAATRNVQTQIQQMLKEP